MCLPAGGGALNHDIKKLEYLCLIPRKITELLYFAQALLMFSLQMHLFILFMYYCYILMIQISAIHNVLGPSHNLTAVVCPGIEIIQGDSCVAFYDFSTRACKFAKCSQIMMTSSNGNIFRVTGHLCGEFTGEFSAQRPVARSFGVFFDLILNKRLSKQTWGWWFETSPRPWWHQCNDNTT